MKLLTMKTFNDEHEARVEAQRLRQLDGVEILYGPKKVASAQCAGCIQGSATNVWVVIAL